MSLTDDIKKLAAGNSINAVLDSLLDLIVAYLIIHYDNQDEGEKVIRNQLLEEVINVYNANYKYRDQIIKEQTIRIQ